MTVLSSCVDEFDRMEQEPYIEGIADIAVDLTYEAESSRPLMTRSYEGGAEGNAISNITSLVMLVYDGDDLFKKYDIIGGTPDPDITEVINHNDNNNIETGEPDSPTDDKTGKVTFRLKIASGKNYRIYAVANMGDLSEYAEAIKTRDGLKNISRKWIPESLADNSEMFGVFSIQPDRKANDDNSIVLSARTSVLHCWVRRLASKVSVAFDGTELYDNVRVYVTDIYLKDIPRYCYLGRDNVPGIDSEGKEMSRDARYSDQIGGLWEDGGKITVQTLPADLSTVDEKTHIHLCNNEHSYLGAYSNSNDPSVVDKTHENKAPALFFYENMQGEGKSKKQDAHNNNHPENETPDNKIDYPNPDESKPGSGWKDEKAYGSYVEVKGFYYCKMPDGHVSSGPITYRFMLGQDVDKNYDATRNTHYQLTLAFKGYGNDADWHIDYQEERGMYATTPQYISYLYNKKMVTTVKVVGRMKPGTTLDAKIVDRSDTEDGGATESLWHPWGDGSEDFPSIDNDTKSAEWPTISYYYTGAVNGEGAHQSFLSLRQTKLTVIPPPDGYENQPSWNVPFDKAIQKSKDYFTDNSIGSRSYEIGEDDSNALQSFGSNDDNANGVHTVIVSKRNTKGEPIERIFKIPLYTRAKELVTRTGFTGNNPYYSYPRKQKVKFTALIWDETKGDYIKESFYVDIIQVRRIINPKGVWRKSGSTKGFHVRLYRLLADNDASNFSDFKSEGTWSAEILTDPNNIISLSSTKEGSGDEVAPQVFVKRVQGSDRAPIDFNINFNGIDGCAIIRVRYHDYTCEHDIFCREGYDPIPLGKNGTKWSSFNVDHFETDPDDTTKKIAVMTKSPLDEGSLFRRKSYTAIASSNNAKYPRPRGENRAPLSGKLDIIDDNGVEGTLSWSETKGTWENNAKHVWEIGNIDYKVASIENFYDLVAVNNDRTFTINKAYGIIYGDESNEVKKTRIDAYGYTKDNKDRGMVGVIVYDSKDASQIFFPLGTEGCGRRKGGGTPDGATSWDGKFDSNPTNRDYPGTLRYSSRSAYYGYRSGDENNIKNQPLFYDLYRRPGAVYWCETWYPDGNTGFNHSSAFDMNFFTMGFEGFQNGAAADADTSDACFLRLVKK